MVRTSPLADAFRSGRLAARTRAARATGGRVPLGASAESSDSWSWDVGSTDWLLRDDICPVVPMFDA